MFWGAGGELGQAPPLLPFLDGLRVREPSANPRRDTITRLLRGELTAERGADMLSVLAEQLMALVGDGWQIRRAPADADDRHDAPGASRDDLLALRRVVPDHARLHLAGLTTEGAGDLVATLTGGTPDDSLLRLAGGTAGNPLYLTELVATLARSSSLTITDTGTAELAGDTGPRSLSAGELAR